MKNILISTILLMLTIPLLAEDWLTIYNNDLSLVRNRFELELVEGRQDINYSDITSRIDPASVIVTGNGIRIAEQNYEYDLAGKWQIMAKYLDREVLVITKDQSRLTGILKFYSDNSIGIIEKGTDRLLVISESETQWIQLAELPENFYTKPTLHWNIIASKKGKHPVQMSYLTGGFSWDVTYNTVWDEKTLQFNSWVTINNTSGKAFNDVNLKLIAGDINQVYSGYYKERKGLISYTAGMAQEELAPSFDEKAFHDFHMYTLDQKVSFANNQTKQLELYPSKNIKAYSEYEYPTYATKIKSMIKFKNTAENGAGMPLPKGIIKVYKQDSDGNLEFIGEDSINHTSKNEEVSINTGTPFDLIASTRLKEQTQISKYITESLIQVTLRNNSDTNKTIKVTHQLSPNTRIVEADYKYTKDNNDKVTFSIDVAPDKEIVWTFRQRSE
ncbi:MAG TPA: DUF4139 domain-containing protein [Candidatus Cloacimonas sp.]|jgi:hypothetical protein|nr:DUF4139 domain-containing protein [Candidatus Cloacimonas sp.]MDD2250167.1 DUF4139 domain-containing protein [Candidatus Cloacimonadota bacterium]MCK9157850.1 DUF4139 domain-containing protein [Candidatus Cloacimonas sp.]MCK9165718.1 DUF4139 domain-containing protein [Candidatus Cloacimonas sp.]MDD3733999.1 DUF4139 domain-containing protein [Candidatus Cloacimonadota bacterium]